MAHPRSRFLSDEKTPGALRNTAASTCQTNENHEQMHLRTTLKLWKLYEMIGVHRVLLKEAIETVEFRHILKENRNLHKVPMRLLTAWLHYVPIALVLPTLVSSKQNALPSATSVIASLTKRGLCCGRRPPTSAKFARTKEELK